MITESYPDSVDSDTNVHDIPYSGTKKPLFIDVNGGTKKSLFVSAPGIASTPTLDKDFVTPVTCLCQPLNAPYSGQPKPNPNPYTPVNNTRNVFTPVSSTGNQFTSATSNHLGTPSHLSTFSNRLLTPTTFQSHVCATPTTSSHLSTPGASNQPTLHTAHLSNQGNSQPSSHPFANLVLDERYPNHPLHEATLASPNVSCSQISMSPSDEECPSPSEIQGATTTKPIKLSLFVNTQGIDMTEASAVPPTPKQPSFLEGFRLGMVMSSCSEGSPSPMTPRWQSVASPTTPRWQQSSA